MKTFLEEIRLPDEKMILDYLENVLRIGTISDLLNFDANQKRITASPEKYDDYRLKLSFIKIV
ncbi:MAG TPA: hypothetical protein PK178_11975 [Smithellaceae bacterium]|nr:hypothetical protein [Smithellaceae bacterium]